MKQHVTLEQIKELNKNQLNGLVSIIGTNKDNKKIEWRAELDRYLKTGWNGKTFDYGKILAVKIECRMTIGKMIEILDKECYDWELYKEIRYSDTVVIRKIKENRKIGFRGHLCDALWEAVKEVLK
jgi:hypothetical protein